MKRIIPAVVVLSSLMLLLASCEKEPMVGRYAPAIKLTVGGVVDTKASAITTSSLQTQGVFKLSAYVTKSWQRDSVGNSGLIVPGIYVDPGQYSGAYDPSTATPDTLKDVNVKYSTSYKNQYWRIEGNTDDDYENPRFSWVNNVPINFFAYAPVSIHGTRGITKSDSSVDAKYPFTYAAAVSSGEVTSANCDDIIFAYTSHTASFEDDNENPGFGTLKGGTSDMFDLNFYHALAQIRFCVSTDDGTFNPAISLKSITLKGVSSAGMVANGSCEFNGSASTFGWTLGSTKANYIQTFGGTTGSVTFGTTAPDGWTLGSYTDSGSNTYNLYTCTSDALFLIPQNPKDCVVDITLSVGGTDTTITGKLQAVDPNNSSKIWEAGKVYTYKVKAGKNGGLDLLPDGWFNGGGNINI